VSAVRVMPLAGPLGRDMAGLLAALHDRAFAGVAGAGWSADALATIAAMPGAQAFLSQMDDAPGGLLLVRAAGAEMEILTFAVDPASRRAGHGRALMRAAASWALAARLERAVLEVAVSNVPALAFYRRCGFVEIGQRRAYYRQETGRVDALVMAASVVDIASETADLETKAPPVD
jgi:ribosomal-protein-alanine N-acetyltransferase